MTTTSPLSNGYTQQRSTGNGTSSGGANTDYETFVKLLVAQMKNQDPTEPVDATQYISQLASFSAVEQAMQTNNKLDELLVNGPINQAGNYIGKYVASDDGKISGTIQSVKIYTDGLIATLDNGKDLLIGPGVTVSDKAPADKT